MKTVREVIQTIEDTKEASKRIYEMSIDIENSETADKQKDADLLITVSNMLDDYIKLLRALEVKNA